MKGCIYRKDCYMKDIECYFGTRYPCIHKDTVDWLRLERQRKSKEINDIVDEDIKLQMELQR